MSCSIVHQGKRRVRAQRAARDFRISKNACRNGSHWRNHYNADLDNMPKDTAVKGMFNRIQKRVIAALTRTKEAANTGKNFNKQVE